MGRKNYIKSLQKFKRKKRASGRGYQAFKQNIAANKRRHASKRAKERCELILASYERMHTTGESTLAFTISRSQFWVEFVEPSGKSVYGLWNTKYQTFTTFLTQEMFKAWLGRNQQDGQAKEKPEQ
ncbi:MAG: hypothetical protein AAF267_07250 [Deinococcota bacterium]